MKSFRWMVALLAIALLPLGLSGCKPEEEKTAAPAAVEQKMEEAKAVAENPAQPAAEQPVKVDPAAAKPKDHPAH